MSPAGGRLDSIPGFFIEGGNLEAMTTSSKRDLKRAASKMTAFKKTAPKRADSKKEASKKECSKKAASKTTASKRDAPEKVASKNAASTYLQSLRHFKFKFFGLGQEMATRWPYNWSPGLILGAFCTIFRA